MFGRFYLYGKEIIIPNQQNTQFEVRNISNFAGKFDFSLLDNLHTVCILRLKSLWTFGSVWGKNTLNTGSMCGAGEDPQA